MLGVLYAALGAFTFALNNVAFRRGVVTGSVLQGMAMTVPIGGFSFLVLTGVFGQLASRWVGLPPVVLIVPGTMFLLPGSLAFRGVLQLLGQNVQIGDEVIQVGDRVRVVLGGQPCVLVDHGVAVMGALVRNLLGGRRFGAHVRTV